jgi:uncharacterized membrane protein
MELTPEERRRIYEEEKARIEAEERLARQHRHPPEGMTIDLAPATAGLLCYVGWWISGLIFFVIEQRNDWVRFHAAQSLVTFGMLTVAGSLIGLIPYAGPPLAAIVWGAGFVLWIVCMLKAYRGERFHLPVAGDLAEQMVRSSRSYAAPRPAEPPAPPAPSVVEAPAPSTAPPPAPAARSLEDLDARIERRVSDYFARRQGLHTAGSAVAIAWSTILLVFFNFFNDYAAYYSGYSIGGRHYWTRFPLFTADISRWLPILNTTLILAIIGHVIIIAYYRPILRNVIRFVLDCFGMATVLVLLAVFPFDFTVLPSAAQNVTELSVRLGIAAVAVGMGIALVVKFVRLMVAFARDDAAGAASV